MTSTITNLPRIVEQGTEGGWTYRKWSDGTSEAWKSIGIVTQSTGAYSNPFPRGLFVATDSSTENTAVCVTITPWYGSGNDANRGTRTIMFTDGSSTSNFVAYLRTLSGGVYSGYFGARVYAIGKWK